MGQYTTKKLPELHLTYNSATGDNMSMKPGKNHHVGQTSDSEQEMSAYHGH